MPDHPAPRLTPLATVAVVTGLILGIFLAALETTVVATAMPRVVQELGGERLYAAPFAVFMLMTTVTSPLWGRASDLWGRRRLYLLGVVLFLLGSALCGAARSMAWLVTMRCLQGIGAGALTTLTMTIIGELFSLERRAKVQGYISGVWGLAGLLGPVVGGLIVDHASWRWVFYLNLPFGVVAAGLVATYYKDRPTTPGGRLDLAGAGLFTVGNGLLILGLESHRWLPGIVGLSVLLLTVVVEVRHPSPLLPLRILGQTFPRLALLCNFFADAAFFGAVAYLPLFAQGVADASATAAGAVLTPMVIGWTSTSLVVSRFLPRLGLHRVPSWGFAVLFVAFVGFAALVTAPLTYLAIVSFVAGCGMGLSMLALLVGTQEVVPQEDLGAATAALLFTRSMGGALGVAGMHTLIGRVQVGASATLAAGLQRAFILGAVLVLVAWLLAVWLARSQQQPHPEGAPEAPGE